MKKLKKINDSCAIVALLYCSGLDEDTVIRICKLHGFEAGRGMEDREILDSAKEMGLKVRKKTINSCRLSTFIKNNPKGLFLVGTHDHLFVIDNSLVIDPRNETRPGLGRIINQTWKVCK